MMIERISPAEAQERMNEGWIYLDVRSVPEFEAGHPAGAYNVPLMHMGSAGMEPNPSFLDVVSVRFAKDTKLVIGCQAGARSLKAAQLLEDAGYTNVLDQRAGWGGARDAFGQVREPGWEASGLPTETRAEPGHSYQELHEGKG